jgi:predicted NUDIX family phosphoesterase
MMTEKKSDDKRSAKREKEAALERQIAVLEAQATEVLNLKKDARPKRPIIIEFCGSPKSGKTQAVTSLTIFLKRNGFNVKVLTERASVSPVSDKRSPYFNAWTGSAILTGLIPFLSEPVTDVDVVIADRGVFDTLCWFTWLLENGAMSGEEGQDMIAFFLTRRFRRATDLVLAFTASPTASMEREYSQLLTRKFGSIMAPEVLSSYVASVKSTIEKFGPKFKNVTSIDTSALSQNQVAVEVTKTVLETMRDDLVEKVGVVPRVDLQRTVGADVTFPLSDLSDAGLTVSFRPRNVAEGDQSIVQLVPIVVVTDEARKKVMVFRKRKESTAHANSPERNRNLLYVGGHMRSDDAFGFDATDLAEITYVTVEREMTEELGTSVRVDREGVFGIWDHEGSDSSQRHLAVVFVGRVNFDEFKVRLDGYELVQPRNSDMSGKVVAATDASNWPAKTLEPWSRAILARVFGVDVLSAELDDFDSLL